jgi:threonine/homoserine/homoserine lactone efflux protein
VAAFLVVDLLLVLVPGADWAYAIGAGLRRRALGPAVAGLVLGYAVHTALSVAGLALLVATTPGLLPLITLVGAGYLLLLGVGLLRRPPAAATGDAPVRRWSIVLRGAAVSGLNPKGLLLHLALLPQFVDPAASWPAPVQVGVLGVLHMANCAVVYTAVGAGAGALLRGRPRAAAALGRASGAALVLIAAGLLVQAFPS